MADLVDAEFPISLEALEELIIRIHNRYPMVDKPTISQIVRTFFKVVRQLLIQGERLHLNRLFQWMELRFWLNRGAPSVKISARKIYSAKDNYDR